MSISNFRSGFPKTDDFINKYMKIFPYTYLIGWTCIDRYYYGVRYAKKCHPDDLWVTYFTSSKLVKDLRELHGEPDIIQVRRTFNNTDKAILWEQKVLGRLKVLNNKRWINQNIAGAINITKQSNEHISHRVANRAKTEKQIQAALRNLSKACEVNTGRKQSQNTQEKKRQTYFNNYEKNKVSSQRNPWVKYLIDGTEYVGNKAVMAAFGITEPTIYNRVKSSNYNWIKTDGR